jgi:endonuclease/exonuclease/phosphatase (EEP) superfamily protein YafD
MMTATLLSRRPAAHLALLLPLLISLTACRSTRPPETPTSPHFTLLSDNVNWGAAGASEVVDIIFNSRAEIICLQETTPQWESLLRSQLRTAYPHQHFRNSQNRMGGGLAFLSTTPLREVAFIPSDTGWFDAWIMQFQTSAGPVQILNVHLRPPVSDRGSWTSGYFNTRDDRVAELETFVAKLRPGIPTLVAGDFNDSENSPALKFLREKGMLNALPQFDRSTPTWQWRYRGITLSRRMDHILYTPDLHCTRAEVHPTGPSDHFPLTAMFVKK